MNSEAMNHEDQIVAGHLQELRRGSVVLACLSVLRRPQYGYSLLRVLDEASIQTDANTLYPLLRRLESQGLLTSAWNTDGTRPRKFYSTSDAGDRVLERLATEWTKLGADLAQLLRREEA